MQKKVLYVIIVSIIFSINLKFGVAQSSKQDYLHGTLNYRIDSVLNTCKNIKTIEMEFTGSFDFTQGLVKGKMFLSENREQIVMVSFELINTGEICEYFCLDNKLSVVLSRLYTFYKDDETLAYFSLSTTKTKFSLLDSHLNFYDGLKKMAGIK